MSNPSRRKLITAGLATVAGVTGLAASARIASRYGLLPPNSGGLYGPGESLTYASQRLLTGDSLAREFPAKLISNPPYSNGGPPRDENYKRLEAGGFADWRLDIGGMVASPLSLSIADLKGFPARSQTTALICEEGWSFIAEWTGVPLSDLLAAAGIFPEARFVVYESIQKYWRGSIDMADALHPQTLLTHGMNGGDLAPGHGGPLRMRVPRQLGYKSVKYVTSLTVTSSLEDFPWEGSYSWYAGI